MYVRAIRCHMKSGMKTCSAAAVYYEMLPHISAFVGFLGASLMVNENTRTAISFTYWDSAEHALEAGEQLRPMLFERTCDIADNALDISGYHVLHHAMKGG